MHLRCVGGPCMHQVPPVRQLDPRHAVRIPRRRSAFPRERFREVHKVGEVLPVACGRGAQAQVSRVQQRRARCTACGLHCVWRSQLPSRSETTATLLAASTSIGRGSASPSPSALAEERTARRPRTFRHIEFSTLRRSRLFLSLACSPHSILAARPVVPHVDPRIVHLVAECTIVGF